jgi:hypothetical protein
MESEAVPPQESPVIDVATCSQTFCDFITLIINMLMERLVRIISRI